MVGPFHKPCFLYVVQSLDVRVLHVAHRSAYRLRLGSSFWKSNLLQFFKMKYVYVFCVYTLTVLKLGKSIVEMF